MATAFRWQERGAAAVEFALIAVVLLVFMLGVIDVGRLLWVQHNLSSRSADALRFASLRGAQSGQPADEAQVIAYMTRGLAAVEPDRLAIGVSWDPDNRPNSRVTIDARYRYDSILTPLTPLDGIVLRSSRTTVIIN